MAVNMNYCNFVINNKVGGEEPFPSSMESAVFFAKPIKDGVERVKRNISEEDTPSPKKPLKVQTQIQNLELVQIAQGLGYKSDIEGVCQGIISMGNQAVFARDVYSFNRRIEKLGLLFDKHREDIQALAEELKKDADFLAFFDGIELWYQPYLYPQLFEEDKRPIHQSDPKALESIASILMPKILESKGEIVQINQFSGVYNLEELIASLKDLREILDKSDPDVIVAINFSQSNHVLSIAYDSKKKSWYFIDSNNLPIKEVKADEVIADLIYSEFEEEMLIISNEIFVLKEDAEQVKEKLAVWFKGEAFTKSHEISLEKAEALDVNATSWLYIASQINDKRVIDALLKYKYHLDTSNSEGNSPLLIASYSGHVEAVQALLDAGADVHVVNSNGSTALFLASQNGTLEIVRRLLAKGAKSNLVNNKKITPLYIASQNGYDKVVEILLSNGADSETICQEQVPLYIASERGHEKVVKILLKGGATVDFVNPQGQTPLYIASQEGHLGVVKALLEGGATVDFVPDAEDGVSPLWIAVQQGHVEIVRALLAKGADPKRFYGEYKSALVLAKNSGHSEIIKILSESLKI